jgi:predicted DNA-binding ArsR family transcriptional regulator
MIRRPNEYSNNNGWDGVERRTIERRYGSEYDRADSTIVERVEHVVEVPVQKPQESAPSSKFFSNGTWISICFSVLVTVSGFVFNLYKDVTSLTYKQQTIFEKIDEIKVSINDLKTSIKDVDTTRNKMEEHISSIEETVMELYRHKK